MKYVSVAEMIEIEQAADAAGYSYQQMMEAAGKGLAEIVQADFGGIPGKRVTALVGSGNNGGDALVALDYLVCWGWRGQALLFSKREDADPLIGRLQKSGGKLLDFTTPGANDADLERKLLDADILVDGILGTGIKLPLREPLNTLLDCTRSILLGAKVRPRVVAVDCPSGVDCDTGEVAPSSFPADITVTMAAVKQGLLKFPAYDYLGELKLVDIGLSSGLMEYDRISREVITAEWVKPLIPARPLNAHKGVFGTVLVVAGSENYPGAAVLAGKSAYRAGAGLVTVAVPGSIFPGVISVLPEATWLVLDDRGGGIASTSADLIKAYLPRATGLLVGPGLGTRGSTKKFLEGLLRLEDLPALVLDADALRLAASLPGWPGLLPARSVLTPHPGELAAMTGLSISQIQADRVQVAEQYARQWNQILLLKGAHSVIAEPSGQTKIVQSANPALARAGSGDVLGGTIASLLAQGMPAFEAAACGAWIHARTGDLAAVAAGSRAGVMAGDLADAVGRAFP
jgi:hydroxyethylthiazole kinase-like uncharacterized protein yjeF